MAVTLWACVPGVLDSIVDRDTVHPEVIHDIPQSLQANSGIVCRLVHTCYLPNHFKLSVIIQPSIRRYIH
jgi:hypothetical protein